MPRLGFCLPPYAPARHRSLGDDFTSTGLALWVVALGRVPRLVRLAVLFQPGRKSEVERVGPASLRSRRVPPDRHAASSICLVVVCSQAHFVGAKRAGHESTPLPYPSAALPQTGYTPGVEVKPQRGAGCLTGLTLAGALLILLAVGAFVPFRNCWCHGFAPDVHANLIQDGWRCDTCDNKGKLSNFEVWLARRTPGPGPKP